MEVYSPAGLDSVAQRVVNGARGKLALAKETVNGRVWNSISDVPKTHTMYWTYDGGYLLFGPDRAVLARAIATRAGGTPLVRSARFREMQPATPSVHNSGFVWLNTRGALESLLAASGANAPVALRNLLSSRDPVLLVFNGETERIAAYSRTRLTSLLIDLMLTSGTGQRPATKTIKRHATGD